MTAPLDGTLTISAARARAGPRSREGDRRARYRRCSVFVPAEIADGGRKRPCHVVNISASGALVRILDGPAPAQPFTLHVDGYPDLPAVIVRGHDDLHGIAFLEPPRKMQAIIERLVRDERANRDRRRFPRRRVLFAGSFYLGDQFVPCTVQDLSVGGAFVEAPVHLGRGHEIVLRIDRFGSMPAAAVWTRRRGIGVRFVEEPATRIARLGHILPPPPRASLSTL